MRHPIILTLTSRPPQRVAPMICMSTGTRGIRIDSTPLSGCRCHMSTPHSRSSTAHLRFPGVVGVGLGCSILGRPLDDPTFDPVFAELNRRRQRLFVHPVGVGGGPNSDDFGMTWMLASRFEDTIAMARLILSGLTLRYPDIRFIIPHLGGTLVLFLQRMDNVAERDGWCETRSAELLPSDLARRFWFDTVNEQHSALRCACETFGAERLLLGTDWPMLPPAKLKHFVDYVPEALDDADARRILDVNAAAVAGARLIEQRLLARSRRVSGEAGQWLPAVVCHHIAERSGSIDPRSRRSTIQLGVSAVEIADDPLSIGPVSKRAQVGRAG